MLNVALSIASTRQVGKSHSSERSYTPFARNEPRLGDARAAGLQRGSAASHLHIAAHCNRSQPNTRVDGRKS